MIRVSVSMPAAEAHPDGYPRGVWVPVCEVDGESDEQLADVCADLPELLGVFRSDAERWAVRVSLMDGERVLKEATLQLHPAWGPVPRIEVATDGTLQEVYPTAEEVGLVVDRVFWETNHVLPSGHVHPLLYVPPGTLNAGDQYTEPRGTHEVPGQFVSKYPTTVREWNAYADATGRLLKPVTETRPTEGVVNVLDHPVTRVTWKEACAWAEWAGLGLPTEWEWEWAARGPDHRIYPWGNEPPTDETCVSSISRTWEGTAPVTEAPAGKSPFGIHQMSGGVWEWTSSIVK